jgi:hypothetical protein
MKISSPRNPNRLRGKLLLPEYMASFLTPAYQKYRKRFGKSTGINGS